MTQNNLAVITSVPWTDTDSPLMAPGVLKSCLTQAGISSVAIDLNQEIKQRIQHSPNFDSLKRFFNTEQIVNNITPDVSDILNYMADRILSYQPTWVCLSLLTYLSQTACRWLCFVIKSRAPEVKIVIGGPGVFISLKSLDAFALSLKSTGLIDHFISGDGEKSIVELLQGNSDYPGIDTTTWRELENLDQLPAPDFDDYDLDLYAVRSTPIWGSRGCVRSCTFCDIHEHWSKFQWRSAENIFAEMQKQYEKYGINIFNFADSLVNGNQKEYKKLIRLLADFNRDKPKDRQIKWTSFFIFRPRGTMTEEDWRLTAESGAILLKVGVESFVEHIRDHVQKKFSNQDLDDSLRFAQKYRVPLLLLLLVGYPTESEADHLEQLDWVKNNKHYSNNPVKLIRIGNTVSILPGTWLYRHKDELKIEMGTTDVYQNWTKKDNGNTLDVRLRRHREFEQALVDNGFNVDYSKEIHVFMQEYVKNYNVSQ